MDKATSDVIITRKRVATGVSIGNTTQVGRVNLSNVAAISTIIAITAISATAATIDTKVTIAALAVDPVLSKKTAPLCTHILPKSTQNLGCSCYV